jgi:NADH-quinone oxidoreductase subunit A
LFEGFLYVLLFLLLTLAFAGLMVALPVAMRRLKIVPHRPNPAKNATYECGLQTVGRSWVQYNPRYYFYALLMVALDVMAVIIFPWAVRLRELGTAGLVGALIFIGIIVLGYAYAWRKKVLVWK